MTEEKLPVTCPGCGMEIDPDWCWCGDRVDRHTLGDGHSPVPMGCTCGFDNGREEDLS